MPAASQGWWHSSPHKHSSTGPAPLLPLPSHGNFPVISGKENDLFGVTIWWAVWILSCIYFLCIHSSTAITRAGKSHWGLNWFLFQQLLCIQINILAWYLLLCSSWKQRIVSITRIKNVVCFPWSLHTLVLCWKATVLRNFLQPLLLNESQQISLCCLQ